MSTHFYHSFLFLSLISLFTPWCFPLSTSLEMENFPPTNNADNNQETLSPFTINNSDQGYQPNSLPPLDRRMANSNVGQLMNTQNMPPPLLNAPNNLGFYYENTVPKQEHHSLLNMSGAIPNQQHLSPDMSTLALPNPPPVSDVGNGSFNFDNLSSNMPVPGPENVVFNVGSSASNARNGGNVVLPRTMPRGRPLGSKNKAKMNVSTKNEYLPIQPLMTLEVPPKCDIISWLLALAESQKVCITVLGGFGSISEVAIKYVDSQPVPFVYSGELMAMMSISGTYMFSPEKASDIFLGVTVARANGQVFAGTASKIVTIGRALLTVSFFN